MLKTNAVARVLIRTQCDPRKVTIAAHCAVRSPTTQQELLGAHKGRCANVVVIRGPCTEVVWLSCESACLVVNPIMVDNFAALFNCMPVNRILTI